MKMDVDIPVVKGQTVLLVQSAKESHGNEEISKCTEKFLVQVGSSGSVRVVTITEIGKQSTASCDILYIIDPVLLKLFDLDDILRTIRPKGIFVIPKLVMESVENDASKADQVISTLTLHGFINATTVMINGKIDNSDDLKTLQNLSDSYNLQSDVSLYHLHAYKPAYEVGTSVPIKLPTKSDVAKAWTLAATDMVDDIDIIDSDTVLDADDFKKPDPSSLKSCGVSDGPAKRKACKNCTCGLAEQNQTSLQQPTKTSACGNCYLGDAFRCSGCPYLGTPAFKPGDKVQIPVLSLQDDDI